MMLFHILQSLHLAKKWFQRDQNNEMYPQPLQILVHYKSCNLCIWEWKNHHWEAIKTVASKIS